MTYRGNEQSAVHVSAAAPFWERHYAEADRAWAELFGELRLKEPQVYAKMVAGPEPASWIRHAHIRGPARIRKQVKQRADDDPLRHYERQARGLAQRPRQRTPA